MRTLFLLFLVAFASTCFLTTSVSATPKQQASATQNNLSIKRQKELIHLLKQDCGSCHGMTLKGGLGPALLPENLQNKPSLFLQNTILKGRPGTAMPPWETILTKQEIQWLTNQLQLGIDQNAQ